MRGTTLDLWYLLKGREAGGIALTVLGGLPSEGGKGRGEARGRKDARTLRR